jgi:integrase
MVARHVFRWVLLSSKYLERGSLPLARVGARESALIQVTAEKIEVLLHRKGQEGLSPKYVNHLRGYLAQAFNAAKKTGRYAGVNPISAVAKRRVPRRLPDFLRAEEVPAVLQELSMRWQPLFATAGVRGASQDGCRLERAFAHGGTVVQSEHHQGWTC